jgi:hypothetical protein
MTEHRDGHDAPPLIIEPFAGRGMLVQELPRPVIAYNRPISWP